MKSKTSSFQANRLFPFLLSVGFVFFLVACIPRAAPIPWQYQESAPGELVVGLEPEFYLQEYQVQELLAQVQAEVIQEFPSFQALVIRVPQGQERQAQEILAQSDRVRYVEPNWIYRLFGQEASAASWGLDRIRSPQANRAGYRGQGARTCVVDTGIRPSGEFSSRIILQMDFTGAGSAYDGHGHGTHVAGTIAGSSYGVAPGVKLLIAKALTDWGAGSASWIAAAIQWCADNDAQGINLSLGGLAESSLITSAVQYALARGSLVAAAAGNENTSSPAYPAASKGVIGVVAVNKNDTKSSFSNWGNHNRSYVSAPGELICSIGGCWSGTSMATPHVTGLIALLKDVGLVGEPARERILRTAVDLGNPGEDVVYGWGRIDAYAAVSAPISSTPTPTSGPLPSMTPTRVMISPTPAEDVELEVARLVNLERGKEGLWSLKVDERLVVAARRHSQDMANTDFCGHDGSDGSSPFDRVQETGYNFGALAENVACGYVSPAETVKAWMDSPGHRALIMLTTITEVGAGYAAGGSRWGRHWTLVLARQVGQPIPTLPPTPSPSPVLVSPTPSRTAAPTVTPTGTKVTPAPSITPSISPSPTGVKPTSTPSLIPGAFTTDVYCSLACYFDIAEGEWRCSLACD